jgi:O-antigen/teichoic acid export membrane protein
MIRTGFWFSLLFVLLAPEGIELFLKAKWVPMTSTFQLMIIYVLFDPLIGVLNGLLIAVGQPSLILRTRLLQLIVFIPSVILLATINGIEGVAIAADIMIIVGTIFLFRHVGQFVDYSRFILWGWPMVALLITSGLVLLLSPIWAGMALLISLLGKAAVISGVYWSVLILMERDELQRGWQMIWGLLRPRMRRRMGS